MLLATSSVLLILVVAEAGIRVYHRFSPASRDTIDRPDLSQAWKGRWIERHQGRDPNEFEGSDEYHPRFGWKPRPNLRKARFHSRAPISTNSRGWRNLREFAFEKPANTRRIVLLGDSFTFGEDEEDEHIWPALLQESLRNWEVINLGVHGYGTDQELLVLEDEGVRYRPDIVILAFFPENVFRNALDFRDYAKPRFILRGDELILTNVPVPTPAQILGQGVSAGPTSHLWRWAADRLGGRLGHAHTAPSDDLWRLTIAILRRMRAACKACGADMLVAVIPNPRRPDRATEEMIARNADTIGYGVLNLGPELERVEKEAQRPTYYVNFSRLGHVVAARTIRDKLVHVGWVKQTDLDDAALIDRRYRLALNAQPLDPESEYAFALFLAGQNRRDEAIARLRAALAAGASKRFEIHTNLGTLLMLDGQMDQAAEQYGLAIQADPNNPIGPMNLGDLLMRQAKPADAARWYRRATELRPEPPTARAQLAAALAGAGRIDEAIVVCRQAIAAAPEQGEPYVELSRILNRRGQSREATEVLREGLRRLPHHGGMINNLAWILATSAEPSLRDGAEAVRLMERLGRSADITDPGALDTLAAAYAEAGQFDQAIAAATRAIELAKNAHRPDLARVIEERLRRYRAGQPYREKTAASAPGAAP